VISALVALAAHQVSADLLSNSGFEAPITFDGPPFVGSWEGFSGGEGSQAANSAVSPHSGAQHLALSIFAIDNTFAGVFQDVPNLVPGTTGIFSGWDKTTTNPLDLGVEIRIEWRNSVSNTEISRTPNLTPIPSSDYTLFSLSSLVPAGADTARVVYAIQTFGPEPTNNGTVFVDDVSFVVPEPATMAILGVGGVVLLGMRRRPAVIAKI
jgi:hypothetical protein